MAQYMNIVDVHNHLGGWSPDAGQTLDELLSKASELNLNGVAISDHYDADADCYPNGDPWVFDAKEYMDAFYDLRRLPSRRQPGDPPGFLISVELGWTEAVTDELCALLRDNPFDYGILSVHYLDRCDPFYDKQAIYRESLADTYTRVINVVADSAKAVPEARIIGHYDFFSRYATENRSKMFYRQAPDAFDRLFRIMHENGQILEINAGTIDSLMRNKGYSLKDALPDKDVLRRYRELGGHFLAFASDAHYNTQFGRLMRPTLAYAASLGFRDWAWFEAGELRFTRLQTV